MRKVNRRQFIRILSGGVLTVSVGQLLSSCASDQTATPASTGIPPSPTASAVQASPTVQALQPEAATPTTSAAVPTAAAPGPTAEKTATKPAAKPTSAASASGKKGLVVVRGGEPDALVRRAIEAMGGMGAFVKKGADVIIKPNICVSYHSYEYAATTNPWVVGSLVKMAYEAGAKRVRVMDYPFGGGPEEAYAISGIADQVKAAGGTMEVMSSLKFKQTKIPKGKSIQEWSIYEDILKADVVINVPIAKNHSLAVLTLGMKNLMGVILDRDSIHYDMGQKLADLTSVIRPTLTVVDAVRILTANGPTGGSLDDVKKLDTLIVSKDIVAADTYAASLFGYKPEDFDYIVAGAAMGLGTSDLSKIGVEEINLGS